MSRSCGGPEAGGVGSVSGTEHEVPGAAARAAAGGRRDGEIGGGPAGSRRLRSGGGEFAFILSLMAGHGRVWVRGELFYGFILRVVLEETEQGRRGGV